jgi:hypothetical protein
MANPNEYLQQILSLAHEMKSAQDQFLIERQREIERLRGVKVIRLPLISVTGANPLLISGDQFGVGPDQGWVWSLKLLVIEGLTRGATPDVLQITRQGRIIWELNGNVYAQTFGKGDQILYPGEFLGAQSVGAFASTAKIIIHGAAWQVPAEEIGKIL